MREGGGGAVFKPTNPALPLVLKARRANWEQPSGLPHLLNGPELQSAVSGSLWELRAGLLWWLCFVFV